MTPGSSPSAPKGAGVPKPADFENGSFAPENHDDSTTQAVLGVTMTRDAKVTAKVKTGAPCFTIASISVYNLTLKAVGSTPGSSATVYYWDQEIAGSSDGVTALAVKKGQRLYLGVTADVPINAIPPGAFAGSVLVHGGSFSRTVAVQGMYLGVDPATLIGEKWQAMGGDARFGRVLTNAHLAPDGLGTVQTFANGVLYQVPHRHTLPKSATTARIPSASTRAPSAAARESSATGRAAPSLSLVSRQLSDRATQVAPSAPNQGGSVTNPLARSRVPLPPGLLQLPPTVFFLSNGVYAKWLSLAGVVDGNGSPVWSALGFPIDDTFATPEGGEASHFDGGAIVVRTNGAAYVVYGSIYAHYRQMGSLSDPKNQPFLGLPDSDEQPALAGRGRVSRFDAGDIYWTADLGAHEVHGDIRQHWLDLGGAGGFLGFPVTDETGCTDGVGRYNIFEGGRIYWTPTTGPHEVHGAILDCWGALGFERSYLGYPVSDETAGVFPWPVLPGRVNYFQFGQIFWSDATGAVAIPDSVTQSQQVLTPAGTALGGTVTMTLGSDGNYTVQFHMHDSGFVDYDFQVHAVYTTQGGPTLAASHSGHVEGSDSWTPWHDPNRDDDSTQTGSNPWIQTHWDSIKGGKLWITKDYSATGVVGFFEDLGQAIIDIGAGAVGGALGVVFALGSEIGNIFGDLGLGGPFGVIAGAVVFAFGGGVALAIIAGVGVGLATNALIQQRPISVDEYALADTVFKGTLPPASQIILTNMAGMSGRAFTMPGEDGNIYVNLGDAFDQPDPIHYTANNSYKTPGELLVHELTHVWQISHSSFEPGFMCDGIVNQANYIVGEDVYVYGPPGPDWGDFNLEAQGAIVDQWFGGVRTVVAPYRSAMSETDPYFRYIRDNIRANQT